MPPASNAETTPSTRKIYMNNSAKRRVDIVYPSGRCLVENVASYNMVEYAHILPRATDSITLSRMERSWKMRQNTLNVDSRYNIIRLGKVIHGLFDKDGWILLPEDHVIQQYFTAKDDPAQFPTLPNGTYKYRLLAHPDMKVSLIHRQHTIEQPGQIVTAAHSTPFSFPFTGLGLIESHIHPKFVIARTGQTLALSGTVLLAYIDEYPAQQRALYNIMDTYAAWNAPLDWESTSGVDPFKSNKDGDGGDGGDDDRASSSRVTRSHRARSVKAPIYRGSSGRQRQRNEPTDGLWLDDETLREFDRALPEQTCQGKMVAVQHWLAQLQPENDNVL